MCLYIISTPFAHSWNTVHSPQISKEKKKKSKQLLSAPTNPAIIHSVMFSGLCRLFLYTAAFHDPSTWVRACQNLGQNVLAARSLLKSSYSLYSTSFHLQLLQFDKEQVQLVFTTQSLETYIFLILFLAICVFSNLKKKKENKFSKNFFEECCQLVN